MQNLSRMAKLVLILLAITVASFIIAGMIFFSEYGSNISIFNSIKPKNAVTVDQQKTADISAVKNISVETASSDVNFLVSNTNEVKAHFHGYFSSSSKDFEPELVVTNTDGYLLIKIDYKPDMGMVFNSNLDLDVYLPASYQDNLEVHAASADINADTIKKLSSFSSTTASGNLKVRSLNADKAVINTASGQVEISGAYGSFSCETTSGDFKTDGITAKSAKLGSASGTIKGKISADDLKLNTASGDITADPVSSKACEASTASGSITLRGVTGNVTASSASGDINLSYDTFGNNIDTKTFSGRTVIDLPANAQFRLDYTTMSGSGSCDFPITITGSQSRHNIHGTVVSDNNTISVNSTSGDLNINKK